MNDRRHIVGWNRDCRESDHVNAPDPCLYDCARNNSRHRDRSYDGPRDGTVDRGRGHNHGICHRRNSLCVYRRGIGRDHSPMALDHNQVAVARSHRLAGVVPREAGRMGQQEVVEDRPYTPGFWV